MGPAICLHLAIGTAIWNWLLEGDTTAGIPDAFYFAVVTFLTIGYGDITPASPGSKVFYIIYIAMSLIVQLTVVSAFVSDAIHFGPEPPPPVYMHVGGEVNTLLKVRPRLIRAGQGAAVCLGFVTGGAALLHYLEGRTWLDAFYWSLTTISTTGYGDITPSGHRVLFAIWFLLAVILFGYVLSEVVGIVVEARCIGRLHKFLSHGVTPELIERMDAFHDNQVSRAEFMLFVLQELQLVDAFQLDRVLQLFDALDIDGDGVLTLSDVRTCLEENDSSACGLGAATNGAGRTAGPTVGPTGTDGV